MIFVNALFYLATGGAERAIWRHSDCVEVSGMVAVVDL